MPGSLCSASASHQWNASDYSKHSSEQQKWARELIAKLSLQHDERMLDIGCGDGKVTAELAAAVPDGYVLGIDASRDMVDFARQSFPASIHANLSFENVDARNIHFRNEFDVVFSNATLHWIIDHRPVLTGVVRALKPEGRALLQMGGRGCAHQIVEILDDLIRKPEWRSYYVGFQFPYRFHGPEEYRHWLIDAGLQPIRVELIPKDMIHQGREALAGWLRTTWIPYSERLPESLRLKLIDEIVNRHLARNPLDEAGNAHVEMIRLEVEATSAKRA